jgi:predicted PhzF superfamily epimerase YddE/YHI9
LAFAAPPLIRSGPIEQPLLAEVCLAIGVDPGEVVDSAWADNGPGWLVLLLSSAQRVLELDPDVSSLEHGDIGIVGFHPSGASAAIEVRGFFKGPMGEHREDPVTGSLNASIAQWLLGSGRVSAPYSASQGTRLGRAGRVHVSTGDGEIWVGGDSATVVSGSVEL